jgi:hypothetical protein
LHSRLQIFFLLHIRKLLRIILQFYLYSKEILAISRGEVLKAFRIPGNFYLSPHSDIDTNITHSRTGPKILYCFIIFKWWRKSLHHH